MADRVIIRDLPDEIKEALGKEVRIQRLMFYTRKVDKGPWSTVNYREEDDKLYYAEMMHELKMGAKLYLKRGLKRGFTFDRKTGKVSIWFGGSMDKFRHLTEFLEAYQLEWVVNEGFNTWLTKTLFEKILAKTITNPTDAAKFIIQANRLGKHIPPKKLKDYIRRGGNKNELLRVKDVLVDLVPYIDNYRNANGHFLDDLIVQAKALGKKFDITWSRKRLNQLHSDWTKEIMEYEAAELVDEDIDWDLPLPEGVTLLKTRKEVFKEGTIMNHCIYTNYWDRIKRKTYIALHITHKDTEATAGIEIEFDEGKLIVEVDQVMMNGNIDATLPLKKLADSIINPAFVRAVASQRKPRKLKLNEKEVCTLN